MPDSAQGTNKHLRIGGQSKILMYNREIDDATLPDLSPQGIATSLPLPTGTWECFEYHWSSTTGRFASRPWGRRGEWVEAVGAALRRCA